MHFGKSNPKEVYFKTDRAGNENDIEETNLERDLGVIVGSDLKWREQVDRMVAKANRTLGMLRERLRVGILGYGKIYTFL